MKVFLINVTPHLQLSALADDGDAPREWCRKNGLDPDAPMREAAEGIFDRVVEESDIPADEYQLANIDLILP